MVLRLLVLALNALASSVMAQGAPAAAPAPTARAAVPFNIGERADYSVKYGPFSVGGGVMEVVGLDTIRGRETWHTIFRVRGGVIGFRVDDRMESWMDTQSLASLRHRQELDEGPNERERQFEIYPDRGTYVENGREPQPTVTLPLDDGSFLYFLRTIPLEVGKEYSFDRYFRPDRNPVRIQVLRKETVTVPAGTFNTVVIRPIIKARGVFSENGRAEVWLTDDSRHLMVQMKSHMKLGSLNLYLKSFRSGTPSDSASSPKE
ncbi:MAG TPA: DUF3108 domain-containing protein [Gemmatimonadaceae bacterium]|nr:DUF3108 domain-containing protein [Gemmatimonadaceae bacterium]